MSLCFTIRTAEVTPLEGLRQGYPYVVIEPDYYQALLPCFEAISRKTGKLIDLYDWVEFEGEELKAVAGAFEAQRKQLEGTANPIVVNWGKQRNPDGSKTDLVSSLSHESMLLLLQRTLDLIGVAEVDAKVFVCKGD